MPHPFSITIKDSPADSGRQYSGTFSDDDLAIFELFVEAESELGASRYVLANMPLEDSFSWDAVTGFAPVRLPPVDQISEFLHRLRPFILENEKTHVLSVLAILGRYYDDRSFRANLRVAKTTFQGRDSQKYFLFKVGDLVINSDEALRVWLNAFEYHRDLDKRAYLGELSETTPLDVMKVFFLNTLRDKASVTFWVAMFLRCALKSTTVGHTVTIDQRSGG